MRAVWVWLSETPGEEPLPEPGKFDASVAIGASNLPGFGSRVIEGTATDISAVHARRSSQYPAPPDVLGGLAGLAKLSAERAGVAPAVKPAAPKPAASMVTAPLTPYASAPRAFTPLDDTAYREHLAIKGLWMGTEASAPNPDPDDSDDDGGDDGDAPWAQPAAAGPRPPRQRHLLAWMRRILSGLMIGAWAIGVALAFVLYGAAKIVCEVAASRRGGLMGTGSPWDSAFARFMIMAKARIKSWREKHAAAPRITPVAVPFQPDIDEIIEEPAPRTLRSIHYFVVALFVTLVVISALVHVEIVVQGSGQITTEIPPIVLQPMERGIIREINVKVGDIVSKGQVLASLDPTFSNADVETLAVQNRALASELRRIEAEINAVPFVPLNNRDPNEALQLQIYNQRQSQYSARLRSFDEEISRWKSNLQATADDRTFLQKQLGIAGEVERMRTKLWQQRLTSKLQYLESQTVRLRYARDHQTAVEKLNELRHGLDARRADRQAFVDEWRRQLLEELQSKRTELARVTEALSKAERLHDLVLLTAPEDGVVLEVAKRSVGSVMREAETFVTMVPTSATLIAEIMIGSGDVGYVMPGDRVVVKVDAFPYQRHGLMEGRLLSIGEESFNPGARPTGEGNIAPPSVTGAQHRARIALTKTNLEKMQGARLIPGMTLSAEIKVGKRSVISYFLYPITRGFGEAIREP